MQIKTAIMVLAFILLTACTMTEEVAPTAVVEETAVSPTTEPIPPATYTV